jgi:histidine triad (HIT) family protein
MYTCNMPDSLFTKIINGEIPCHKVYEDERTLAFLDIHPIQPGHTLVISKAQVEFAWDLADADYQAVMATAKKVALRIREMFPDKSHVGMIIEGLDVPHTHLKVFPFNTDDEFRTKPDIGAAPDQTTLAAMAQKLAFQS